MQLNEQDLIRLKNLYEINPCPSMQAIIELSRMLNLNVDTIILWFQYQNQKNLNNINNTNKNANINSNTNSNNIIISSNYHHLLHRNAIKTTICDCQF